MVVSSLAFVLPTMEANRTDFYYCMGNEKLTVGMAFPANNRSSTISARRSTLFNTQSAFLLVAVQALLVFMYYMLLQKRTALYGQERTWNGGNPNQQRPGSCWCNNNNLVLSADSEKMVDKGEYCLCTPNLAIDVILLSEDHSSVWLVRRRDTGQYAVLGGFVQVGESVEQAVYREVHEEMNYKLTQTIHLVGVYSNPNRDSRRHTVSIAYYSTIPKNAEHLLQPADDVKEVVQIALEDIGNYLLFSDHGTMLSDFFALHARNPPDTLSVELYRITLNRNRSLCI